MHRQFLLRDLVQLKLNLNRCGSFETDGEGDLILRLVLRLRLTTAFPTGPFGSSLFRPDWKPETASYSQLRDLASTEFALSLGSQHNPCSL